MTSAVNFAEPATPSRKQHRRSMVQNLRCCAAVLCTGLLAAMVAAGLCGSNREARQLVQQGGVLVDGEKVTDPKAVLTVDALNKGVVIKKGKKVYHKVVL